MNTRGNQTAKSKRGGRRPGAGRPPAAYKDYAARLPERLAAIQKAAMTASGWSFVIAMHALEAPFEDLLDALGMDAKTFDVEFGKAFRAYTARLKG